MLAVAVFVLLGAVARAGREVAIAYRYGVSAQVDAYLFVFNLINWPVAVWFSVLTVIVMPLAARIKLESPDDLSKFRAELLALTLVFGVGLMASGWWWIPAILQSSIAGLPSETQAAALPMVMMQSMLAPLGALVGLFSVWTMSDGRHANTLLEGIPSLCIMLTVLLMPVETAWPLLVGTLAGFVLHASSLAGLQHSRQKLERPSLRFQSPHWKTFAHGFGIVFAGQLLMSFTTLVDQFYAGGLGAGSIATLNYANRILILVMGVGAMVVSRSTLPVFSDSRKSAPEAVNALARRWVGRLFAIGTVAAGVAWILAPWVTEAFFERGAFRAKDTSAVAEVFRFGVAQIPFYWAGIVLTTYLSSRTAYTILFWSSVIAVAVKVACSALFSNHWGLNGLALSNVAMYATTYLFLIFSYSRLVKKN
jgi:putative peptidoglycan lipid II flippase